MSENPFWPPFSTDIFGPLVARADVRDAVKSTLQLWTEAYLAEIRTRRGLDTETLPSFQDWTVRPEYRTLPITAAPACMITCPGVLKPPTRKGDGTYLAHFGVQISVVVFGTDWEPTEDMTSYYTSAVIAALVQHPSLGDVAQSVLWLGNRYGEVEHSSTKTLGAEQINFDVVMPCVVNSTAGPASPSDPNTLPPTATSVDVSLIKEPLT